MKIWKIHEVLLYNLIRIRSSAHIVHGYVPSTRDPVLRLRVMKSPLEVDGPPYVLANGVSMRLLIGGTDWGCRCLLVALLGPEGPWCN